MATPAPLIEVSGSPEGRGSQYGEAARERIRKGIAHYGEQLGRSSLKRDEIRALVEAFLPAIAAFDADYVPEMRGIARGAGVDFADIVLLNARTEVLKLGARKNREAGSGDLECTAIAVTGEATADGRLIHAQNWDWKVDCAETAVVLKIARDDGPDILTFTEAGALARSGFNAAGIAITANYLQSDRDYRQSGVPLALIRRKVLQQSNLALAMHAVYATPKSAANNMMVSHPAGVVIDFECAPDETFQVHPDRGILVHANHWQSPVALSKLRDTGVATTPDSLYRDLRVLDLVAPYRGRVTSDIVKQALADDFQTPYSVCRPPRPNFAGTMTATVAMVVMSPTLGTMEVAMLPALGRTFTTYRLAMEDSAFQGVTGLKGSRVAAE
ncbi:MAG: C45 family peptidase [Hyphomicrobiaceae bacterium]